jgi:predicted transposase/invertase (TIGR01784 family)
MQFLNPKTDFAFKRIFGSAESGDILISLLNAILGLSAPYCIAEVSILDPYLAPEIYGMKNTYLDVRATDQRGREYIIEMQVLNVEGFEKRVLYNACKTYSRQLATGEAYQLLTDVIAISITDFVMFEELPDLVNSFKFRAASGEVYSDDLEMVFVELPKFNKPVDELATILEKWLFFLKNAGSLQTVPKNLTTERPIEHAFQIANKVGMTLEELESQEKRLFYIQDQLGALTKAERIGREAGLQEGREAGREAGMQEGIERGIEQGRLAEKLNIARSLLDILDDATIALKVGVEVGQVRALRTA